MTDAIPEDVLQAAREAYRVLTMARDWPGQADRLAEINRGEWDRGITLRVAARAILAERERCATAIYEIGRETSMRGYIDGEVMGPAYYEEVIRKGVQNAEPPISALLDRLAHVEDLLKRAGEALEPISTFIAAFDAKPLSKSDDEFYGIHAGTEYEAYLRFSYFRAARAIHAEIKEAIDD